MSEACGTAKKDHKRLLVILLIISSLLLLSLFLYPRVKHLYMKSLEYEVYGGMTDDLKDCCFYEDMISGSSFCFIGDSITDGCVIGYIPWYEPLISYIDGNISNFAHGGWTSYSLVTNKDKIPEADIYVIAIGVNDILSIESELGKKEHVIYIDEFISNLEILRDYLYSLSPSSKIYYIAPWKIFGYSEQIDERQFEFCSALEKWCNENGLLYIDPNPYIVSVMIEDGGTDFYYNGCHPDAPRGVGLFSYAVLKGNGSVQ